jgi:predicted acyl esterase
VTISATVAADSGMAGYELMVAGDIMRGRYRTSWERPEPIPSGAAESYTVDLHHQLYTFRRGHRIMVQVQSSWFPLYDRNPQTWVDNIFLAPAGAYHAHNERIYRSASEPSGPWRRSSSLVRSVSKGRTAKRLPVVKAMRSASRISPKSSRWPMGVTAATSPGSSHRLTSRVQRA